MGKLFHSNPAFGGVAVQCAYCLEAVDEHTCNPIASDLAGDHICEVCAPQVIEDNGQFGVGA